MNTIIRMMTRQAYDVQELRIAVGLRVVTQFRDRFGTEGSVTPEDRDAEDRKKDKMLKEIRSSYERVTDGVAATARKKVYHFDDILRSESEIWFVENYLSVLSSEEQAFKRLQKALDVDPFYTSYLKPIRGIGPAMAGVILSELDPYRAKYPSSFWKYAGLDVVPVFDKQTHELVGTEGRGRREHHLVDSEYTARDGTTKIKRGLSYNPWLKSKLLAVLGGSFLKANNERYVKIYHDYKFRQLNRPELQDNPGIKAIAHKRAIRYMIKQFLVDLHMAWRAHEGLEVSVSYGEAKLGLNHGRDPSAEAK